MTTLSHADDFSATPARLGEVLTSQSLVEARAALAGGDVAVPQVEVAADGSSRLAFTVSLTPEMAPEKFRKFIPGSRDVQIEETWSAPDADGSRTGTLHAVMEKPTVSFHATTRIEATATGSRRVIDGDLEVKIPLLGGTVEKQAVARVPRAFAMDAALVEKLLG